MSFVRPLASLAHAGTMLLTLVLAGQANAVVVVEGNVSGTHYDTALRERSDWFQRAINVCGREGNCKRPVAIRITVSPEGNTTDCRLLDSDIRNPKTAGLFCQVARSATFPSAPTTVVIEHHIGIRKVIENGIAHCPATIGNRTDNPSFVRSCLDDVLQVLEAERSSEHHQFDAPMEDMTGTIRLVLTIKPSGKVSDVDVVETDIKGWTFRRFIVRLLEATDFGPSPKRETYSVIFSVPFTGTQVQ